MRTLNSALCAIALSGAFTAAHALDVVTGNVPPLGSNFVRNPCGLADATGTGNPVFGCLNDNHAQLVQLASNEPLVVDGGQASLDSADGTFSQLTVSLVDAALGKLILNIDATEDGFVTFLDGTILDGIADDETFALDADGENFFTVTGITSGSLSFITYNSLMEEAEIVTDVNQIRLTVGAIPEPETYALLLGGLGLMGFVARRRKPAA